MRQLGLVTNIFCRRSTTALLLTALVVLLGASRPAEARTGYPKVLNYHLSSNVDAARIQVLAKWDVLVLDAGFDAANPGAIAQMRALNPDILILGYIAINGTYINGGAHPPESLVYRYWEGVTAGDFWLYSADGSIVSDWPEKGNVNLTVHSPTNAQGEQFWEWFARFVYEEIWQEGNGPWDGIFLDDVWDKLSWLNSSLASPIDSDRDGVGEDAATLDAWWREGNDLCTARLHQLLGPGVPLVGNGGNSLYAQLNGTMIENFPYNGSPDQNNLYGYAWRKWMFDASTSYFDGLAQYNSTPQTMMMVNTHWSDIDGEPDRNGRFEAHKRLCLGSTLLGDGYFSLDASWDDHNSAWWEPEYDVYLGAPLGPAYQQVNGAVTLWRRDYEAGMVIVNPNNDSSYRTDTLPFIGPWDGYIGPPPDLSPPNPVSVIAAEAIDPTTVRLTWNAVFDPGGSGVASRYDVRVATWPIDYGPSWIQATVLDHDLVPLQPGMAETLMVSGLDPNTTYYFSVRTFDAWENLSEMGVVPSATTPDDGGPPPTDVTPPGAITDLAVTGVDTTSAGFSWTAVGDDGTTGTASVVHGRLDTQPVTEVGWALAPAVSGLPAPALAGTVQQSSVGGLSAGTTYYLALRAEDEAGNLGDLGAVIQFTTDDPPPPPADTTGPETIDDLAVVAVDETWLDLTFTAPADAEGAVVSYDLRYLAGAVFDPADWDAATLVVTAAPQTPGTMESIRVEGLTASSSYVFRVRATDDAGNPGALSDPVSGLTADPPPVDTDGPAAVTDLIALQSGQTWIQLRFTAPADAQGVVSAYDLRYREGPDFDPADWDAATVAPVPEAQTPGTVVHALVGSLAISSEYAFRLRSVDDAGNWSDLSAVAVGLTQTPPPPPPADTTGPEPIADLAVVDADETWLDLTFTAPADAEGTVASYDLRYRAGTVFDLSDWDAATPVPTATPRTPGLLESVRAEGLVAGSVYSFRILSVDGDGNPSLVSDPVLGLTDDAPPPPPPPPPGDTTPPAAVMDLVASVQDTFLVRLTWNATGDDGNEGRAAQYDLRWREGSLDSTTWASANVVSGMNAPLPAGWSESFTVAGLPMETTLAFALVAVDSAGNSSALSNRAAIILTEPEPPDTRPPGEIEDVKILDSDAGRVTLQWSPSPEPDLSHYRVYRGRLPGGALVLFRDRLDTSNVEDRQVIPGRAYVYVVTAVDAVGNESAYSRRTEVIVPWTGSDRRPPGYFLLGEPYPNPSPGRVQFSLETGAEILVRVEVFDVRGRRVRRLPDRSLPAGDFTLGWDGTDDTGRRVGRGIYFLRVNAGGAPLTKKVHLLP